MNECREENPHCNFHPRELVVGICALCLRERLLVLASRRRQHPLLKAAAVHGRPLKGFPGRPSIPIPIPKVFAFGSLLHLLESRLRRRSGDIDAPDGHHEEDSFISIKFEENGQAFWDNGIAPKNTADGGFGFRSNHKMLDMEIGSGAKGQLLDHTRPCQSLRWRKRISHLFQLARWKRSSKGSIWKVEGGKRRKG